MSTSRKQPRRPSFVVIVTAGASAALAAGCGAAVTPCPDGAVCEMRDPMCPAALPTQGSSCNVAATTNCQYGTDESPCHNPRIARCNDMTHTWQLGQSSCNPPPPMCPPTAPTNGQSCSPGWGPSPNCQYNPCGSYFSVIATCNYSTRQWNVMQASCNPPPPVCPSTPPTTGEACNYTQQSLRCRYGDCSNDAPMSEYSCNTETLTWRSIALPCELVDAGGGEDGSSDGGTGVEPGDASVEPGDASVEPGDGGGVEPGDGGHGGVDGF